MLQKFNNLSKGKKIIVAILALIFFPITLLLVDLNLIFKGIRDKKKIKTLMGLILVPFVLFTNLFAYTFITLSSNPTSTTSAIESTDTDKVTEKEPANESSTEQEAPTAETTITEEDTSKILNVEINETMENNNGEVRFTIQTTLPDTTELMVTLKELNNEYTGQTKVTVMNGTATTEWFSNKGSSLRNGEYSLSISMSLPILQSEQVQKVIGSNGELMQGEYVEKATISDAYVVSKETTVTINKGASSEAKATKDEEHKQIIANFYNQLISEYKSQSVSYNELSFGKFLADWNRRRNEAQAKMSEEDPLFEHSVAITELITLETDIKNKLTGRDYDQQYINETMESIESVINK